MYTREEFIQNCLTVFAETAGNTADIPGIGPVVMYEAPLVGFADAADELFEEYKRPEVIGPNYFTPQEWLPSARTVISFFLPFSEQVRRSNRALKTDPSPEWLYGRIEGQEFINRFMQGVQKLMKKRKIESCLPTQDPRFEVKLETTSLNGAPDLHAASRWSDRHAAYACGLGTFGLSKGLITEKGTAGRFATVIVSEAFPATERLYTGIYDYCVRCGACARNCPAHAISLEFGKNNLICREHLGKMREKYLPRYGCGKCQVGVPCETRAPGMNRSPRKPNP